MCRSRARAAGFTLIELSIVIVIISIIAALALFTLGAIRQKNAISLAPKQLMAALSTARQEAMSNGRDVVFMLVGNQGAADSAICNSPAQTPQPSTSARCVRYWIIEDLPDPVGKGRFDYADELSNWPLNTPFENPTRALDPDGDRVLAGGYLPTPIFLGKRTGYTPPAAPPAASAYRDLWTQSLFGARPDCSFCIVVAGAPRMAVRFDPRGQIHFLGPTTPPPTAGIVFLSAAQSATQVLPDTRTVAVFEPFGFATDRLGASIR